MTHRERGLPVEGRAVGINELAEYRPVPGPPIELDDWRRAEITDQDEIKDLDPAVREQIESWGYRILKRIGDGGNRDVYKVERQSGNVREELVAKVPKLKWKSTSVASRIAEAKKRNWDLAEVAASKGVWHPNVAKVVDSKNLNDGRTVNFEPYREGSRDLRAEIRLHGGLKDGMLRQTLGDIVDGVRYLHGIGIIHRDLKPDNIIITRDGRAVITDLQTAARMQDVESSYFPTRGSDSFADTRLLNALVRGEKAKADAKSDIFTLGATVYSMLTGEERPMSWRLEERIEEEGERAPVDNIYVPLVLRGRTGDLEQITAQDHEKELREMDRKMRLGGVSKPYREFVIACLTDSDERTIHRRKSFNDMGAVREAVDNLDDTATEKILKRVMKAVPSGIKWGLGLAIPAYMLGLGITSAFWASADKDPLPATPGLMQREDHRNFGIGDYAPATRQEIFKILAPYIDDAEKRLPEIEQRKEFDLAGTINFSSMTSFINPRIIAAWQRACYLRQGEGIFGYAKEKEDRVTPGFAPRGFLPGFFSKDDNPERDNYRSHLLGVKYLQDCIAHGRDVADVYAAYFSTDERVRKAIAQTDSITYFPQFDERGRMTSLGYGSALPKYQQDLVNTAVAMFHLSDDGQTPQVNFNRLKLMRERLANESENRGEK